MADDPGRSRDTLFTIKPARFFDIAFVNTIAQVAIFMQKGQSVIAPPVHADGLGPVFENVFAQVRVADFFDFLLLAPGPGAFCLGLAHVVNGVFLGMKRRRRKEDQKHGKRQTDAA
jgi:hypothetical protein